MRGKLKALLPVAKDLISMSCPRYFRSEIEEYEHMDEYEESEDNEHMRW